MSLLNIAQRAADIVGLPRPTAVATGTDQLARQMFAIANEVLEELAREDWPQLSTIYTFNTVIGTAAYALPSDYDRHASDAAYLTSQYYKLRGSLSAAEWARARGTMPTNLGPYRFRIFGDPLMINITPTPQTVESVTIEYFSSNRAKNNANVAIPEYLADTDTSRVPEELVRKGLKWRIKHAKGLDYGEDFNDYQASVQRELAQALDFGSTPVAIRYDSEYSPLTDGYVRDTGFGQ